MLCNHHAYYSLSNVYPPLSSIDIYNFPSTLLYINHINKTMTDLILPLPTSINSNSPSLLPYPTVTVYLRLPDSKSVKLQLPPNIPLHELKSTISSHLSIPFEQQLLFLSGKELTQTKPFTFADRSILHIKDKREMYEQVTIQLIRHEPQAQNLFKSKFTSTAIKVNQAQRVRDFLQRYLGDSLKEIDLKRSRVIQCGRFLRGSKTFGEQKIQENAEVHIIIRHQAGQKDQDQQQSKHHEMFVKRVLNHSRNNSKEGPMTAREKEEREEARFFEENRGVSDILIKTQHNLGEHYHHHEPTCINHKGNTDPHIRHSLQPQMMEKSNPQFQSRPLMRSSSFLNHTKASQKWVRSKVKPSELTPIKLGLKEYKKYDGPLSVRACNCKRPLFESRGSRGRDSVKSHEEEPCISPLPSKMVKSQCKLKKSLTVII